MAVWSEQEPAAQDTEPAAVTLTRDELEACLLALQDRDDDAFQKIYSAYYRPVFLLCVSITGQVEAAEDAAQETFLAIRRCADRYQAGSSARSWIFGVARNTALYMRQRQHGDVLGEEALEGVAAPGELEAKVLDGLVVSRALEELTAREYPVVVLHVFGGLTLAEIARYLEIPYGTVLWRYAEAKKKLRRFYERLSRDERRTTE